MSFLLDLYHYTGQ